MAQLNLYTWARGQRETRLKNYNPGGEENRPGNFIPTTSSSVSGRRSRRTGYHPRPAAVREELNPTKPEAASDYASPKRSLVDRVRKTAHDRRAATV